MAQTNSNPFGFEDNTLNGWTPGSSSENVAINSTAANIRTGLHSLQMNATTTSSNKYFYTNNMYGASGSTAYVHFIYWAKGTDAITSMDASLRYSSTSPPSGTGSSANATSAVLLNATTWTRISYNVGGSSTVRYYFPAPRRTSGNITAVYMDDAIVYISSSGTTDLTDPSTPSAITGTPSGTNVNLAWTSATDAGTGVQATVLLKTNVLTAADPDLNDQAQYSAAGGATGTNTVGDWTVVSETIGATATSYTETGVANGSYKYAVVLRDLAYNYSVAAVSPTVTVGTTVPAPTLTISSTGFNGSFGNVVMNTTSNPSQQYTVSGTNLTSAVTVTAPAGFKVSSTNVAGSFGTTATLAQVAGIILAAPVYVQYAPTAATGVTGSLNITNSTAGATTQNVAVNGNALATEPTTAGTLSFGTLTSSSIVVNLPATGNGSKRIIVARAVSATSYTPADAATSTGVNANFATATDQGSGNKIVYDGTGSGNAVVTVTGLSTGTTYYFTVYEYNEGTGTSQNYLLTPNVSGNAATTGAPTPIISLVTTGFNGSFGNQVMGTASANQQYTVNGANLTGNIIIAAPTDFQIATTLTPTPNFSSTVTLTPASGTLANTVIYVRYQPAAATGTSGNLSITHASTGAVTQNATVSGNALATEPTTAGTISFGTVTATTAIVNIPTTGNGTKRIIVARPTTAVTYTPTDGAAPTGVNAAYTTATDQGNGNKIIYNGTGTGNGVVTVTGLTQGTQYYFTVYEYNEGTGTSQNYLLIPVATGSTATVAVTPTITVTPGSFTGSFGNQVTGTGTTTPQQYTVSATNLSANLNITAPTGFWLCLTATGTYATSLSIAATAGTVANTTIYVKFIPPAATGATGNLTIVNSSTGATNQTVTVSGNALAVEPTTAGTISFGATTTTTAIINLPTVGNGTNRIIVIHPGSAVTFQPVDGVAYTGVSSIYSTATDQGNGNKIVYDGTGSGTALVTVTGLTAASTYYFAVYEYKVGTGTSQNYLLTPSAAGNTATVAPAANLYVSQAGFTNNFGNVVAGTPSPVQSLTVTGSNMTGNATIAASGDFKVSLNAAGPFTASVSIAPIAGSIAVTQVYVQYAPATANGASGPQQIATSAAGASTIQVPVNGNALAIEPTYAGSISFGTVTDSNIVINLPTVGNGSKRIIVTNLGSPAGFIPTDGVAVTGVSSLYTMAANQTAGGKIIYNGIGSGNMVVNFTALTAGMLYYFNVYEYNEGTGTSQNYLLSPSVLSNMTTSVPWPAGVTKITKPAFAIYPNPVNDYLHLDTQELMDLQLLDMTGKTVISMQHTNELYTGSLPAGNYILLISNGGNKVGVQKIVKQ